MKSSNPRNHFSDQFADKLVIDGECGILCAIMSSASISLGQNSPTLTSAAPVGDVSRSLLGGLLLGRTSPAVSVASNGTAPSAFQPLGDGTVLRGCSLFNAIIDAAQSPLSLDVNETDQSLTNVQIRYANGGREIAFTLGSEKYTAFARPGGQLGRCIDNPEASIATKNAMGLWDTRECRPRDQYGNKRPNYYDPQPGTRLFAAIESTALNVGRGSEWAEIKSATEASKPGGLIGILKATVEINQFDVRPISMRIFGRGRNFDLAIPAGGELEAAIIELDHEGEPLPPAPVDHLEAGCLCNALSAPFRFVRQSASPNNPAYCTKLAFGIILAGIGAVAILIALHVFTLPFGLAIDAYVMYLLLTVGSGFAAYGIALIIANAIGMYRRGTGPR